MWDGLFVLCCAIIAGFALLYVYPLVSGYPLPNRRWVRRSARVWSPRHVRMSALGRLVILLGVGLLSFPPSLESRSRALVGVVVAITGAVLATVGDGTAPRAREQI